MSRADGIHLPRLPTAHIKATTSDAVEHHPRKGRHVSTLTEPHYTAYIGTPRQDVPGQVYRDAAMFDDVFDRQGRLLTGRNTPKIISPLNSLEYNSLHDPHCQQLFLNNIAIRNHLISLGMLTDDLRVVANTRQQREKVRSHELLERKEMLLKNLNEREKRRKERLQSTEVHLPSIYQESLSREEQRKARHYMIERKKLEKQRELQNIAKKEETEKKREKKKKLQEVLEQIKVIEQIQRNAAVYEQQQTEVNTYQNKYGKTAVWHRESDRIHNRIVYLQRMKWSKENKKGTHDDKKEFSTSRLLQDDLAHTKSKSPPPLNESDKELGSETEPRRIEEEHEEDEGRVNDETATEEQKEVIKKDDDVQKSSQTESKSGSDSVKEDKDKPEGTTRDSEQHVKEVVTQSPSDNEKRQEEIQQVPDEETKRIEESAITTSESDKKTSDIEEDSKGSNSTRPLDRTPLTLTSPLPLLSQQDSAVEIANLFFDILQQFDTVGTGYIHIDVFRQVMSSSDLALPLDGEEIDQLTSQIHQNGWIPLIDGTSILPSLLINLLQSRLALQIDQYGVYVEDRWLQLSSPNIGYIYLDKTTGLVQREVRPPDYRPYLKNDLFEDVIVDFFESADVNRDGYVDQAEVLMFLQSPDVQTRVYAHQFDELYKIFIDQSVEGTMKLEQFVPFAHVILQMIYSNSFPNDEWVELESRKCGKYYFNPSTGETKLPDEVASLMNKKETPRKKSRSRRRRRDSKDKTATPKPPPLRKKSSSSRKTVDEDEIKIEPVSNENEEGKISRPSSSKQEENKEDENESSIAEQVADRLQKGLRIIETIEEEEDRTEEDHTEEDHTEEEVFQSSNKNNVSSSDLTGQSAADDERDSIDSDIDKVMEKVLNEKMNDDQ